MTGVSEKPKYELRHMPAAGPRRDPHPPLTGPARNASSNPSISAGFNPAFGGRLHCRATAGRTGGSGASRPRRLRALLHQPLGDPRPPRAPGTRSIRTDTVGPRWI